MKRVKLWRSRFNAIIDDLKRKPFSWEDQHDCGLGLACGVVEAITGVDHAARFRERYSTPSGALRMMRKEGFDNLAAMVASFLPEHPGPAFARTGDVMAIEDDSAFGWALGIVNGERVFVLMESGFGTVDLLNDPPGEPQRRRRAFKVG